MMLTKEALGISFIGEYLITNLHEVVEQTKGDNHSEKDGRAVADDDERTDDSEDLRDGHAQCRWESVI